MTEGIWIAIIGGAQALMLALFGKVARTSSRAAKDSARAREHVENSHVTASGEPYNLRDNIDDNQNELLREIRGVRVELGRVDTRVIAVEGDMRKVRDDLSRHIDWSREEEDRTDGIQRRVGTLEDTLSRSTANRAPKTAPIIPPTQEDE